MRIIDITKPDRGLLEAVADEYAQESRGVIASRLRAIAASLDDARVEHRPTFIADADAPSRCKLCGHHLMQHYAPTEPALCPSGGAPVVARPDPEDAVQWIVNDTAELGVMVNGNAHFLYKGHSLIYEDGKHDDGTQMVYRRVFKREFGECCHPAHFYEPGARLPDRYTDGDGWLPVPVKSDGAPKRHVPLIEKDGSYAVALHADGTRTDLNAPPHDANYFASALWRLTKGMDLAELGDYDDELASDTREARAAAHLLIFGVPHSDAAPGGASEVARHDGNEVRDMGGSVADPAGKAGA